MFWRKKAKKNFERNSEINPDEIFLDSSNLPKFNIYQFEGRIEKPISKRTHFIIGSFFILIGLLFLGRIWVLQVRDGQSYSLKSEYNRLRYSLIFAERGVIYDRNDKLLASNTRDSENDAFSERKYIEKPGFSLLLGYVKYPARDSAGFFYNQLYDGKDGVEKHYNAVLSGINGIKIIETNARGEIESQNTTFLPQSGKNIYLSIDSELQAVFYDEIKKIAEQIGYTGGAAAIMDVKTGEIIVFTSYPEYNSQILSNGKDVKAIQDFFENPNNPFLDRIIDGLYTPGSTVKPFVALAALSEKIIDPSTKILSTGSISLPNVFDPTKSTVFNDWKAHGYVDMREAISVSSDVYFYEVGGGYKDQKGLGINNIEKYLKYFGFGESVASSFFSGKKGVVPNPQWKEDNFDGEKWNIGNTYHTAIGQYGFQATPIQELIAISAIANDGVIIYPTLLKGGDATLRKKNVPINKEYFKIVKEGMRMSVTSGVAGGVNIDSVNIAAKTGTAELGTKKQYINSWIVGYFPYEKPRYAFVVIMEKGPSINLVGASSVARHFFEWVTINKPEYLK